MSEVDSYLRLKLSQELYRKPPSMLEPVERQRVDSAAARQRSFDQRFLSSAEAAQVVLPASSLWQALAEVRGRYGSDEEFLADIESSGLDHEGLMSAIERDLKFDAILDGVASRIADVSETDIEIFYLMHRDKFCRPETRTLRHVLVTINESLKGNDRASARRKIDNVRARLLKSPERFAELAMRYSECTTAMNGGLLGVVEKGQLFPELEKAAFALNVDELSRVVESPVGFHVIHCVAVESASEQPLAAVREKIRTHLIESRRRAAQKEWIATLFKQAA